MIGLAMVLVVALMAALVVAGSPWDVRMTPDGTAGLALVGLLVAWVGASLLLGRRRT